jgi:hypothetical protein
MIQRDVAMPLKIMKAFYVHREYPSRVARECDYLTEQEALRVLIRISSCEELGQVLIQLKMLGYADRCSKVSA